VSVVARIDGKIPSRQNASSSLDKAAGSSWPDTLSRPLKAIQGHVLATWDFYSEIVFEIAF
jgi:hypothetical protein